MTITQSVGRRESYEGTILFKIILKLSWH
jgi:hypothetical protein